MEGVGTPRNTIFFLKKKAPTLVPASITFRKHTVYER
jgi:hypothetical protein